MAEGDVGAAVAAEPETSGRLPQIAFLKNPAAADMSTLPPPPQCDTNIPVVTPAGGTPASSNDPNSPHNMMKKAKTAECQGAQDTMFDTAVNTHESFRGFRGFRSGSRRSPLQFLSTVAMFLLIILILKLRSRR